MPSSASSGLHDGGDRVRNGTPPVPERTDGASRLTPWFAYVPALTVHVAAPEPMTGLAVLMYFQSSDALRRTASGPSTAHSWAALADRAIVAVNSAFASFSISSRT